MASLPLPLIGIHLLVLLAACGDAASAERVPPRPAPTSTSLPSPAPTSTSLPNPTATSTGSSRAAPSATLIPSPTPTNITAPAALPMGYPLGYAGRPPGDGFFIRHGFTTENTWYNPGYWHTGEDWYAVAGETGGTPVLAIADGRVVYAGSNYPGRVVIVEHSPPDAALLYSMYGHLDFALAVSEGQSVRRGQALGTVLLRDDGVPSHLHFEIRDFLLRDEVNGAQPRYNFRCGPRCPPGPGYWPINAPELPTALGWRTPAHLIQARPASLPARVVVASEPLTPATPLYSGPPDLGAPLGRDLALRPGTGYILRDVWSGPNAGQGSSAMAYQVWYQLELADGELAWVQAIRPWDFETGSDGRPSSARIDLLVQE
jgi:murein DD-endopeptidase MepM/ murein hydrolase activator NlpD